MYCTVQDIENAISAKVLAQLCDDDNGIVVNEILIESIIETVSDTIDDYLRGEYTLPLRNSHNTLKQICISLTRYELANRRSGNADENEIRLYDTAIKTLTNIQRGIIQLSEAVNEEVAGGIISVKSRPSMLNTVRDQYRRQF